jgi:BlaI family transcriptional regulator, penicillinase repressor
MPRPTTSGPTERELEILQVLWNRGPSTIRDIHENLNQSKKRKTAYNSVLTILLIMLEKGYVKRDASDKSHVYKASQGKAEMEERLVETFMNRVFAGSAMQLVTKALAVKETSPEERDEIRQLLKEMEEP